MSSIFGGRHFQVSFHDCLENTFVLQDEAKVMQRNFGNLPILPLCMGAFFDHLNKRFVLEC